MGHGFHSKLLVYQRVTITDNNQGKTHDISPKNWNKEFQPGSQKATLPTNIWGWVQVTTETTGASGQSCSWHTVLTGKLGKTSQFQSEVSMFLGKLWSCGAVQYFRTNPHTIKRLAIYSITSSLWLVTILDFGWLNTVLTIINHRLYYMTNADPTFILPVIYPTISDTLTSTRFIQL